MYFVFDFLYKDYFIKEVFANNSYVDMNPMLDIDEDFLYQNQAFRAMIKKITIQYPQLTSPHYDFSKIQSE